MSQKIISVVIPTYNDFDHLYSICSEVLKCRQNFPNLNLIVVNDGSTKQFPSKVLKLSEVRIIELPENKGKANALFVGFNACLENTDVIVFLDADLEGFVKHHFMQLVNPTVFNGYDMSIATLEFDFNPAKKFGITTMFSGLRSFKYSILKSKSSEIFSVKGYLIEMSINKFISYKKFYWSFTHFFGVGHKQRWQKDTFTRGVTSILSTIIKSIAYLGFIETFQLLNYILYMKKTKPISSPKQ